MRSPVYVDCSSRLFYLIYSYSIWSLFLSLLPLSPLDGPKGPGSGTAVSWGGVDQRLPPGIGSAPHPSRRVLHCWDQPQCSIERQLWGDLGTNVLPTFHFLSKREKKKMIRCNCFFFVYRIQMYGHCGAICITCEVRAEMHRSVMKELWTLWQMLLTHIPSICALVPSTWRKDRLVVRFIGFFDKCCYHT